MNQLDMIRVRKSHSVKLQFRTLVTGEHFADPPRCPGRPRVVGSVGVWKHGFCVYTGFGCSDSCKWGFTGSPFLKT